MINPINSVSAINLVERKFFQGDSYCSLLNFISIYYKSHSSGSVANVKGRIYEWFFATDCINHFSNNGTCFLILNLPTISSLNIFDLLISSECHNLVRFRSELMSKYRLNLITSNPDFLIIDTRRLDTDTQKELLKITPIGGFSSETINYLDNLYKIFLNKLNVDAIHGFISLKSSLRPDRRLQIVHESTVTKAMFDFIKPEKKINFISASLSHSEPDKVALNTVALHTLKHSNPEASVDFLVTLKSSEDVICLLRKLNNMNTFK